MVVYPTALALLRMWNPAWRGVVATKDLVQINTVIQLHSALEMDACAPAQRSTLNTVVVFVLQRYHELKLHHLWMSALQTALCRVKMATHTASLQKEKQGTTNVLAIVLTKAVTVTTSVKMVKMNIPVQ